MEDKIFDMGKQKPVAGVVRDSWQHQLWCIYCTNGDVFVLAFQYRVVGSLES